MSERPQVLLVAVGGYGNIYLKEMTEHDVGADIAGICEVMPDIEEKFPVIREKGIPVYHTLDAFYQEHKADLAIIASPIQFHTEMSLTCLKNGSNVLCEKPLCLHEEEAERMAEAAAEAGKFLAVGYQLNYQRDVLALKKDILAGRFGAPKRLQVVHAMRRGAKYYARNNWAGHITAGGREVLDSPFNNACAHNFQMLTFLLGKDMPSACNVERVDAELYRANPNVENYDTAALRFHMENGAEVLYYTTHALKTKNLGPIGRMEFEHATVTYAPGKPGYQAELGDGTVIDYGQIAPGERLQKLYDCLECVKHGGTPSCGIPAEIPHIRAVRLVQQTPILPVNPALVETWSDEDDTYRSIRDIEDIFQKSAAQWKLPREAGFRLDV